MRFAVWVLAFGIDLGTPWLAVPHSVRVPPDAGHLPERFGLFTLILLGESVVALMRGIESQENWPIQAFLSALSGMGLLFGLWWVYFDGIGAAEHQHVRTHRDAVRFHIWSYAHLPLALGVVVLGAGIERTVTAAARTSLPDTDVLIMTVAGLMIATALAMIRATSGRAHEIS
jgi:low temperature requirement protein LtrA